MFIDWSLNSPLLMYKLTLWLSDLAKINRAWQCKDLNLSDLQTNSELAQSVYIVSEYCIFSLII